MRGQNKLTAFKVQSLKAVGKYSDGLGLYLLIPRPGEKFWTFRYMRDGRARQYGLGPLHSVSLVQARAKALEARQLLLDGKDPIEIKAELAQAKRLEDLRTITFAEACERFMATDTIQKLKDPSGWRHTLALAKAELGGLEIKEIRTPHILNVLEPIWKKTPETGSRLRGRLERVFAWAIAKEFYDGTNPAALEVLRDALPSKPKAKHHAAMPYAEVPAFMQRLRDRDSVSARALELAILTATRTSETIGAQWSELDLDAGVWTIPADRMKAKKAHRVPLSDRALELLRACATSHKAGHVFINGGGEPLSNMALLELLKGMAPGVTTHGFRSSFSDWARDRTAYARDVVEQALAHTIKDKSERAYRRGDALEKRARLMSEWARYLEAPAGDAENVVSLRA